MLLRLIEGPHFYQVNQRWQENVDQAHLVLAIAKPVLQK